MNIYDIYDQLQKTYEDKSNEYNNIAKELYEQREKLTKLTFQIRQLSQEEAELTRKVNDLLRNETKLKEELTQAEISFKKVDIWEIVTTYAKQNEKEAKAHWDAMLKGEATLDKSEPSKLAKYCTKCKCYLLPSHGGEVCWSCKRYK